jgi:hypothetical protein
LNHKIINNTGSILETITQTKASSTVWQGTGLHTNSIIDINFSLLKKFNRGNQYIVVGDQAEKVNIN